MDGICMDDILGVSKIVTVKKVLIIKKWIM
jgi:hypothetical protein